MAHDQRPPPPGFRKSEARTLRGAAMTGWQKIGVTLSVLWLIGLPIYIMVDSNRRASEFYAWCRNVESKIASNMTSEEQHEWCSRSAKFMTPTVLAQVL